MIPAEAVEAAMRAWGVKGEDQRRIVETILEAAAPHMLADHLLTLAADVRARGDIGKDGGAEAWDYLTWKAEQIRTTP